MVEKTIAVLKGDGIGPEIMREGLKILDVVSTLRGHRFTLEEAPFGANAYFSHGHPFPESTKQICDGADAILKGPVGLGLEGMGKIPEDKSPEVFGLLPLRKRFDTYANFRPVRLPLEIADFSPLKLDRLGKDGVKIMMIRELVGGSYFGQKVEGRDNGWQFAIDEGRYDRHQIERIAHVAFKEAMKGNGVLTNVSKPNIMAEGRLWNHIVQEVAVNYPGVRLQEVIVDNMAFQLVVNPSQYNGVVLFENMQGDILTDQAAGILGSLGLMASACLNPETGKGYYEPAHGSAPALAGKGIANPFSMIGSVAFMLERSFGLNEEAQHVWNALFAVFSNGYRTTELKNLNTPAERILSTEQFGDMVAKGVATLLRNQP